MKRKKGFTLIELLAVIVILAIILLIAVPIINNVIENVRYKVCDINTKMFEEAALKYVTIEGISVAENASVIVPLKKVTSKQEGKEYLKKYMI